MQLSHTRPVRSAAFDDPNLMSSAGLIPVIALAEHCGLQALADEHLSVPTDKGANARAKVTSLVAGMVAGADSIDDMALLRHWVMRAVFDRPYAPSTLGSLSAPRWSRESTPAGSSSTSTTSTTPSSKRTGTANNAPSRYGYSRVPGLNAMITTVTTEHAAQVMAGQRLRRGACGSPRGAARMIADTLAPVRRVTGDVDTTVLVRADSAFYGYPTVAADETHRHHAVIATLTCSGIAGIVAATD